VVEMRVAKCADNDGKSNATVRKMRGGEQPRDTEWHAFAYQAKRAPALSIILPFYEQHFLRADPKSAKIIDDLTVFLSFWDLHTLN